MAWKRPGVRIPLAPHETLDPGRKLRFLPRVRAISDGQTGPQPRGKPTRYTRYPIPGLKLRFLPRVRAISDGQTGPQPRGKPTPTRHQLDSRESGFGSKGLNVQTSRQDRAAKRRLTYVTPRLRHNTFPTHAVSIHHLLMEHTTGMLLVNSQGLVEDVTGRTAAALGYDAGAIVGQPVLNLVDVAHQAGFRRSLQRPEDSVPNSAVQFSHASRARPIDYEFNVTRDGAGIRVVLTDVASWRAIEWANQTEEALRSSSPAAPSGSREHSQLFVIRLDRQCTLIAANEAWSQLTGTMMQPQAGMGIGPSTWMNVLDKGSIGEFGRSLSSLASGSPFASSGSLLDGRGGVRPVTVAACAINEGRSGFLLIGAESGPVLEARTRPEHPKEPATPPVDPPEIPSHRVESSLVPSFDLPSSIPASNVQASPAPLPAVPALVVPGWTDQPPSAGMLDERTRAIIASVLSAARTDIVDISGSGATDDRGDKAGANTLNETAVDTVDDTPGLFDGPNAQEQTEPFMISPRLGGEARETLAHQLEAMHVDGLDAVVSIALLLVEVELSAATADDENYEMGVLERRLRSAIRDHEYADRHDDRGFVIAARGGFGHTDLQALALRVANRLQAPMRGHQATDLISLRVAAVRSRPCETDQMLITRAEEASAYAADRDLIVYVSTNPV